MFFVLVNYNNPILMLASQAKKVRYIETSMKEFYFLLYSYHNVHHAKQTEDITKDIC